MRLPSLSISDENMVSSNSDTSLTSPLVTVTEESPIEPSSPTGPTSAPSSPTSSNNPTLPSEPITSQSSSPTSPLVTVTEESPTEPSSPTAPTSAPSSPTSSNNPTLPSEPITSQSSSPTSPLVTVTEESSTPAPSSPTVPTSTPASPTSSSTTLPSEPVTSQDPVVTSSTHTSSSTTLPSSPVTSQDPGVTSTEESPIVTSSTHTSSSDPTPPSEPITSQSPVVTSSTEPTSDTNSVPTQPTITQSSSSPQSPGVSEPPSVSPSDGSSSAQPTSSNSLVPTVSQSVPSTASTSATSTTTTEKGIISVPSSVDFSRLFETPTTASGAPALPSSYPQVIFNPLSSTCSKCLTFNIRMLAPYENLFGSNNYLASQAFNAMPDLIAQALGINTNRVSSSMIFASANSVTIADKQLSKRDDVPSGPHYYMSLSITKDSRALNPKSELQLLSTTLSSLVSDSSSSLHTINTWGRIVDPTYYRVTSNLNDLNGVAQVVPNSPTQVESPFKGTDKSNSRKMWIGIGIGIFALIFIPTMMWWARRYRARRNKKVYDNFMEY
ncbi:hypothetical protein GGI20_001534 [Coemansia sp. BCRC 34301]|nr:hypothetical protein GGI20_001534 [Coemansia sp. BCRC 34301]